VADLNAFRRLRHFFLPERGALHPLPYAAVAALGLAAGLGLASLSLVQRVEWSLYDRWMTLATREPSPPPDIVVVAIDEPSFSELRMQWPWPRRVHAQLVDALVRAGAQTIAFDLVFDQRSVPEDDARFADAVRRAGNVVLASDRAITTDRGYKLEQRVDPIEPLAEGAAAVAGVSMEREPDGVIRRAAPAAADGQPSLALAIAQRQPGFQPPPSPADPRLVRFLGAPRRGVVTVSYYQALEPGLLPADMFRGRMVLVGRSLSAAAALDQPDHFRTPVAVLMPGVEIHASLLDTLLRGRAIRDPFESWSESAAWAALFGVLAAIAFFRPAPHHAVIALALGAVAGAAGAYAGLARASTRLPLVAPLLTAGTVLVAASAYKFALGQRERRLIRRAFQHYVSPAIVQQMLDDPSRLKLGGEAYDVTVIFTDLEGFTSVAERMTPEALRERLSAYFKAMMAPLLAERATLDKFIGDAIMVYFGCPIPDPGHAAQACRAALAMQRDLAALNQQWIRAGAAPLRMRIGVNSGTAIAGNMGTDEIFNFTIIGDCVNLASRLEGVNKAYGTRILVGEDTWQRVAAQFEARELDWIRVKGKAHPVAIYELLAAAGALSGEARAVSDRFAAGLALYRARRWDEAAREFGAALTLAPEDGPSRTFADRCAHYAVTPPDEPWDGVHVMTTK
jgi:adenylate cyclase